MKDDWYSPKEIKFTRRQVLFLIKNLPTLQLGVWPTDFSHYIDQPIGKRTGKKRGYFETPVEYAAEIMIRLERAGLDGLILEAIDCWEKSVASMAAYFRLQEWTIAKRRKQGLAFVSGWKRSH